MTNRHMPYPAHPVLGFLVAQKDLAAGYCSAVRYLVQDVNATYEWESSRLHDDESYWLVVADIATEFHETVNEVVDELTKIAIDGQRKMCQRPKRASFISTVNFGPKMCPTYQCVNALNGLLSFLQYPLEPLENTGLPASFLQVFV